MQYDLTRRPENDHDDECDCDECMMWNVSLSPEDEEYFRHLDQTFQSTMELAKLSLRNLSLAVIRLPDDYRDKQLVITYLTKAAQYLSIAQVAGDIDGHPGNW